MKLSCVQNIQTDKRNNNVSSKINNSPNFTGFASTCANFWKFVDAGGAALQFTVEDCSETNIPRSLKGLFAGRKYTGKFNIQGFLQEAIREFLTGPTMCITPVAVLTAFNKLSGKTSNTHVENIRNLSYLANDVVNKTQTDNIVDFKGKFFKTTVEDMLTKTVGKAEKSDVDVLVKGITDFNGASDKKQANKILSDIQTTFESIVKREKQTFSGADFRSASYSVAEDCVGSTGIKNYVGYISSYVDDLGKKVNKENLGNITNDAINSFKKTWIGKRIIVATSMFAITAFLMSFIPKLYTLASGKVNPNASAIYDEASKGSKPVENKEKEVK